MTTISSPITDFTGFVATDLTNNFTVISFQGTESMKPTKTDLNFNRNTLAAAEMRSSGIPVDLVG